MSVATSETIIPVSDGRSAMAHFVDHLEAEHGIVFERRTDGAFRFERDGMQLELQPERRGLLVRIGAPTEGGLIFMKEGLAKHVAEMDPAAAANIRWRGETATEGEFPLNFKVLQVVRSREVFAGLQRVTLAHHDVSDLAVGGVHVKLMLPRTTERPPIWPRMSANGTPRWPEGEDKLHARLVTLRHVRVGAGEVDIDLVRHDGGLISDWACHAGAGSTVGIMGPAGQTLPPPADRVFLAADGTGIAALARLIEQLRAGIAGDAVVAVPQDDDAERYLPETGLRLHAIHPSRFESEIQEVARKLTSALRPQYAFFAGEFQNAQDLRRFFKKELCLDKHSQISTAYWRRGVEGFED
ncbi:siderophore-interacting protein [Amorphus orientalis]|uniref:NADPH-dependent ferric siderophore reductase n=1 Tax=Amorphus orientalis TaxID=649198 RepID=A0AAE4AW84_9HYPH|nr:siderophore-interacting protein [Amorphus orientalis]MDQ0317504.1 NADPH-dependent ferric siderophore reductase [Amorphus orientalis]